MWAVRLSQTRSSVRRMVSVTAPSHLRGNTRPLVGASVVGGSLVFACVPINGRGVTSCEGSDPTEEELQREWDEFYMSSIKPGEDDDDDEDDEDDADSEEEENNDAEYQQESTEPANPRDDTNESERGQLEHASSLESVGGLDATPEEDVDKYENLPDEDEPTTCSICRINRQGPCRSLWRKFEVCMKENIADGNPDAPPSPGVAEKCDKYMMPWISCFQQYRNFYTLATNSLYRFDYLDDAEAGIPESQKRTMQHPDIDLNGYLKFVEEAGISLGDFVAAKQAAELGPDQEKLEKLGEALKSVGLQFKEETLLGFSDVDNPKFLCDCQVRVPLKDPESQLPIEVAYARDQDGNILGFDMFTSAKEKSEEDLQVMNFSVRFGATQTVSICAIYQEEAKNDDNKSETILDKRLYCSEPISVLSPILEAGLFRAEKPVSLPNKIELNES